MTKMCPLTASSPVGALRSLGVGVAALGVTGVTMDVCVGQAAQGGARFYGGRGVSVKPS